MKTLANKTILIGRDPQTPRLLASVAVDGKMKSVVIDDSTIPTSISRIQQSAGTAHCKITIDADGVATITNLKDANITMVNGMPVISTRITEDSSVTLGKDGYRLDIKKLIAAIKRIVIVIDVKPLEKVWSDYEAKLEAITKKQQTRANRRMLPMMISVASGLVTAILGMMNTGIVVYIPIPIMVISLVIYIKNYREKDTSVEDRKKAKEWLTQNYKCPNCGYIFGANLEYTQLYQRKKCPGCSGVFK